MYPVLPDTATVHTVTSMTAAAAPANDLQYIVFVALLAVVALAGLSIYLTLRMRSGTPAEAPAAPAPAQRCDGCAELSGMEQLMEKRFKMLEELLTNSLQTLGKRIADNEAREEIRLAAMERKLEDGFRALHERIDRHIDLHA